MMILSTLRITVSPEQQDEVALTLVSLLGPTQAEPGCASCHLYADVTADSAWNLQSEWRTWDDLDRYIRSDRYRQIMALIDLSAEPPDVQFHEISETVGMEHVRAIRMQ